jgi:hypothetical protein
MVEFDEERQTRPAERLSMMIELDLVDKFEPRRDECSLGLSNIRDEKVKIAERSQRGIWIGRGNFRAFEKKNRFAEDSNDTVEQAHRSQLNKCGGLLIGD